MQLVKCSLASPMLVVVVLVCQAVEVLGIDSTERTKKALSVFTVVKFPNTGCTSSTNGRNGTCYTSSECSSKGGSSSGTCASSFGVCCVFEKTCGGGNVAENCTYFTSTGVASGSACVLTICKCSTDVCQLRLDFETFAMNNPVTAIAATGNIADGTNGALNRVGNCDTDSFQVTNPGGKAAPAICGTNTGQHMYVPASDQCNALNANLGASTTSTTSAFTIKVTQIECNSKRLAPNGCLQYFTGDTGTIETYNYNSGNGVHLANQDYSACIRAGRTYCSICYWSPTIDTGFKLSVPNGIAAIGILGLDTNCGAPALTIGAAGGGFDHILIPGGQCNSPVGAMIIDTDTSDRYCGTQLVCAQNIGAGDMTTMLLGTVCTNQKPFKIGVHTDGVEYANAAAANTAETTVGLGTGFSLSYFMQTYCLSKQSTWV